tara:strand:+ start:7251 stop:9002 length:1752 start_codon:yes stop_codon:yes gene_type:complete
MISLLQLNKLIIFILFFTTLVFNSALATTAEDIWKNDEDLEQQDQQDQQENQIIIEQETNEENSILSEEVGKLSVRINEEEIRTGETVIGIFDPKENNFKLNMWSKSDGKDIKNILKRIDKINLSKQSEDLLFKVLFTNAYPPRNNLSSEEFLKIKINWLINNKRFIDLETLLKNNPKAGEQPKAIKFLINEYLSSADIKSACEKVKFIHQNVQNDYLDKFTIYCLINNDRKDEAQLLLDLSKERGLQDKFFENKINFLLGITDQTSQKILDNNLLNFYLSHITSANFEYEPTDKTDKYIWRYLSSANLIEVNNFEDENVIQTYEKAAAEDSFNKDEVFKIYLKMNFNFNQLLNSTEIYKNLPGYKARALIYQSILLNDAIEKKLYLTFLLKDLFLKDKLLNVYSEELSNILTSIDQKDIPENYITLVKQNLEKTNIKKVEFNNEILHRSKIIKHFLEEDQKLSKTQKDFKSVYKKIKRNKKYFLSIKDIIVLESLEIDGVVLPNDLNYSSLSSELTVPKNLEELANQDQTGLVMLKLVEIIGEDEIGDLDPETIYFLNRILNQLNLKKIRNNILSEALPVKV